MTLSAFTLAVLALLLAPGPTNTLMAVAGATHGLGRVLRLLPVELAAYLLTVVPLALLGAGLMSHAPRAALALKLVAALWVMVLAVRLWRSGASGADGFQIGAGRIFVTTLLNPKALIFGLVLLPAPVLSDFAARLSVFIALVLAAALVWGGFGALSHDPGRAGGAQLGRARRLASGWLALVSVSLFWGVLRS
ncbi:threonine/homoserine/homoserine lactone efflux protein [Rhodobacter viridis]|uniref:Threonine/homoserine/homoserine lactone efflux protein n=1 Tax=Rhodobacter viridis TaxID=1054202 RepID=A0A318TYL2_9RHOB|nr:hypothetical protein [Rhodobacter viridis]PYF09917.1 threonine/homoserine/homoserine lactone efflux protein [Rhodobacter viridis]